MSKNFYKEALEIQAFGQGQQGRVVFGRAPALQEAGLALGRGGCLADHFKEFLFS